MSNGKLHKDVMVLYMFRNVLSTLVTTFLAFSISLIQYYNCNLYQAVQRIFVYDIYTTLYFVLIWVFNYFVFETSKIIYDIYEEKVTFLPCIVLLVLCVVIFFVPILNLFQYNLCFLSLLICMRMFKEMWKRTPELFKGVHTLWDKIKRRPGSGLE